MRRKKPSHPSVDSPPANQLMVSAGELYSRKNDIDFEEHSKPNEN
tara:strand:- start:655 stop:789 length:135 start_codon:yes stop_codon:yes gene_type:complete